MKAKPGRFGGLRLELKLGDLRANRKNGDEVGSPHRGTGPIKGRDAPTTLTRPPGSSLGTAGVGALGYPVN